MISYFQRLLVVAALLAMLLSATTAAEPAANQQIYVRQPGLRPIPENFPGTDKKLIKDYEMGSQVKLLLSRKPAEQQLGSAWFEREHETLIAQFDLVDPLFQDQILQVLNYWISPWERSLASALRGPRHIHLWIPVRPVTRPVDHPHAAKFRTFLLKIVANADKWPVETAQKELTWEEGVQWHVLETALKCLGDVGDAATAKEIRVVLEKTRAPEHGRWCMNCLEQIYGLPEFYPPIGICGLGMEKFEARQRWNEELRVKYYEPGRKKLLAWLDEHANLNETARCRAALAAWEQLLKNKDSGIPIKNFIYIPIYRLARLGTPLVPLLRERQQQTDSLLDQGFAEFLAATITGKVDDRLIRELLREEHVIKKVNAAGDEVSDAERARDREFHLLALRIIQAGHAKGYLPELTAMLKDERYSQSEVAQTLAMVHGKEALPLLRTAPKENSTAWCAVSELEERQE